MRPYLLAGDLDPVISVIFHTGAAPVRVAVPPGTSVHEAAARGGLALDAPCGGRGTCGKCLVRVIAGELAPPGPVERERLSPRQLARGLRLGCQAQVSAPVTLEAVSLLAGKIMTAGAGRRAPLQPAVQRVPVRVPAPTLEEGRGDLERLLAAAGARAGADLSLLRELPAVLRAGGGQVTALLEGDRLVGVVPGTHPRCLGMAVDVGTTTVVGYLVDLASGEQIGQASAMNEQAAFGADVISRIEHSLAGGAAALQASVVGVINRLLEQACKEADAQVADVCELVVVGNTCMHHLLLGLPVDQLAAMPFTPVTSSALHLPARELGLAGQAAARLYALPIVAGFVGADAVAVMLATRLVHGDSLRVAIDIGTNGEVMAAWRGQVVACSTAAGPAFEGAKISQGMRAAAGAIDRVRLAPEVVVHTMGGGPARGLCGSGLIDAVAELVKLGVVEENGRLLSKEALPPGVPPAVAQRLLSWEGQPAFLLAQGEAGPVLLTARDVREAQLAKAALAAGLAILLDELGARPADIAALLLAGAFGNYIDRQSAVAVGLVPALPEGKIQPVGNAAGMGARLALTSVRLRQEAEALAARVRHVELSSRSDFYERFTDAMRLGPVQC